jgi:hypothetical protein
VNAGGSCEGLDDNASYSDLSIGKPRGMPRLGDEAFLEKYASGHQPLGHYLIHEDKHYPMKAVWAAAHRPAIQTRDFKTGAARRGLKALGFTKFLPEKNSR